MILDITIKQIKQKKQFEKWVGETPAKLLESSRTTAENYLSSPYHSQFTRDSKIHKFKYSKWTKEKIKALKKAKEVQQMENASNLSRYIFKNNNPRPYRRI